MNTTSFDLHLFLMGKEWFVVATLPDGSQTDMIPLTSDQMHHLEEFVKPIQKIDMGFDDE